MRPGVEDRIDYGDVVHSGVTEQVDLPQQPVPADARVSLSPAKLAVLAEGASIRAAPLGLPTDE